MLRRVATVLAAALLCSAQTSPVTVTPTLVSVQLGQPIYCAARWTPTATPPTIQVYCYLTKNSTWDYLFFNSIFPWDGTAVYLPYIARTVPGTSPPQFDSAYSILWQFNPGATAGVVYWSVAWAGVGSQSGTFQ